MTTMQTTETAQEIEAVIRQAGPFAGGGDEETTQAAVGEWIATGMAVDEVREWISTARCWDAYSAAALRDAGVTPEQAAQRRADGETVGYAVANGDLSVERALRTLGTEVR